MAICKGTCKNGNACGYKAKKDDYCLIHHKTDEECTICYDFLDKNSVKLECGHSLHKTCLTKWLNESMTCPTCRHPITFKHVKNTGIKMNSKLKVLDEAEEFLFDELPDGSGSIKKRYFECIRNIDKMLEKTILQVDKKISDIKNIITKNDIKMIKKIIFDIKMIKNVLDNLYAIYPLLSQVNVRVVTTVDKIVKRLKSIKNIL